MLHGRHGLFRFAFVSCGPSGKCVAGRWGAGSWRGIGTGMAGRDGTSREVRAFDDLTAQERAEIETFVKPFSAKAGTVLFRQDMPQDRMYLLTSGRVGMSSRLGRVGVSP